jgi:hypothetical protein
MTQIVTETTKPNSRAARKAVRERLDDILMQGYRGRQYKIDAKGRKVRITNNIDRVTREDVQRLLANIRAVDIDDILEQCGENVLPYMLAKGYLKPVIYTPGRPITLYWITKEAAKAYDLRKPVIQGYVCEFMD